MKKRLLFITIAFLSALNISAQQFHIQEDFNAGTLPTGWTNNAISGTQTWSFGINGASHAGNNNLNGTSFAFFDDDGLGGAFTNNHVSLTTPSFDNSLNLFTFLEFDYNARFFNGINDSFIVEVYDGSNWNMIFQRTADDCGNYLAPACRGNFPRALINISAFANANCQVRFRYFDGNDWAWYVGIDNVSVYSPFQNDVSVHRIVNPSLNCGSSQDSLAVMLYNYGTRSVFGFQIGYILDQNPIVSALVSDTINAFDSLLFKFPNALNRSTTSSQSLIIFSALTGDQNTSNDTLSTTLAPLASKTPPYFENFETTNHEWVVGGMNASWAHGVPDSSLAVINSSLNGTQAFVTNLSGVYQNNERSTLTSPCLDFSNSSATPLISFDLIYDTEISFDKLWMESSTNGGFSWSKIPIGNFNQNMYSNIVRGEWTGISNGWIRVQNSLDQLAGQASVKLRFVFETDGSTRNEGVGIDNISITVAQGSDIGLDQLLYPATGILNPNLCNSVRSQEFIQVELTNYGADTLNSFVLAFKHQNSNIIRDTLINLNLIPLQVLNYTSSKAISFPNQQLYSLDIWVELLNDNNSSNDSLLNLVIDRNGPANADTLPYFTDFDTLNTPNLPIDWTSNTSNNFNWRSATSTGSIGTGPFTSPGNQFLYTEASIGTAQGPALLTSQCFDLRGLNSYSLVFDYHKHGNQMGDLFVDVFDGVNWINGIFSLVGETHPNQNDPWLTAKVDLNNYANRFIQIRFRGVYGGGFRGDMAIDNVRVIDVLGVDISLNSINEITSCDLVSSTNLSVEFENLRMDSIPINNAFFNYQINNGRVISQPNLNTIYGFQLDTFTFSQSINWTAYAKPLNLKVWVSNANDTNLLNDTLTNSFDFQRVPYYDSFDSAYTYVQGSFYGDWTLEDFPNNDYEWRPNSGPVAIFRTGPREDHTQGNPNGFYMYTHSFTDTGRTHLISPCIYIDSSLNNPELSYWYHKFGQNMSDLMVDVFSYSSNLWDTNLVVIPGVTNASSITPWLKDSLSLQAYKGEVIKIRFRTHRQFANNSDAIAIDDVSIIDGPVITSIKAPDIENKEMSIYPNPSKGLYNLSSNQNLTGNRYQVFDLKGQLIQEGVLLNNLNQIDLTNSPAGVYFMQINELGIREKLVKY